jgi:tRNA U34 5-methylaminomethyl-2-thiouridine-forming methyltransferase MnmC
MKLELTRTADGSDTLYHPGLDQHFHSTFGAMEESLHIFIRAGLLHYLEVVNINQSGTYRSLRILEVGFGTGLNALLTLVEAEKQRIKVHYTAIEAFPLDDCYWQELNYPSLVGSDDSNQAFRHIHLATWDAPWNISPFFTLLTVNTTLESFIPGETAFDLVFFDAFGPDAQPEMWTEELFRKLYKGLAPGGVLVTYSVKGNVVRALRSAGFCTEKLPGPLGKRHILRAIKRQ